MSSLKASIAQASPQIQELLVALENTSLLGKMMILALQLSRMIAVLVIEEILKERANRPIHWPNCPKCGKRLESKGQSPRQLLGLIGTVCWQRKVGRCPAGCPNTQVVPLDEELGLNPNQRVSSELQRVACVLAVFVPYNIAAILLSTLTGIEISPESIWNWVQEIGQKARTRLDSELSAMAAGTISIKETLEEWIAKLPLIIGADGVMVPFRPNGGSPAGKTKWMEVKVGILARLWTYINRAGKPVCRLVQRRLVAVLGDIDDLQPRIWLESLWQGILTAKIVVWISDGGRGFWRLFRECFAEHAIGILDFYHASQNLWKGIHKWFDGRKKRAKHWFEWGRRFMKLGKIREVLENLALILLLDIAAKGLAGKGVVDGACEEMEKVFNYLKTHIKHMDYKRFKDLGLPIGSGMVESACKWLIQQRFKGVGMRWSVEGFNNLLHLRLAWVNGRFDDLFALEISTPPNF